MNVYFVILFIDEEGNWLDSKVQYNVSLDIVFIVGQMVCVLGLVLVFKKYWENVVLVDIYFFEVGNEVSFCMIGDVSILEGVFWEIFNVVVV